MIKDAGRNKNNKLRPSSSGLLELVLTCSLVAVVSLVNQVEADLGILNRLTGR